MVGYWAGGGNINGQGNVFIGRKAGLYSDGSNNIFIGQNVGTSVFGSNKLIIDNYATSSPLIYGEFDNNILRFNGDVGIGGMPGYKFDVIENSSSWAARIFNDGNNSTRSGLKIQSGTDNNSGTNYMIGFYDGNESWLGGITSSGGVVSYGAKSASSSQKNITKFEANANSIINKIKVVNFKASRSSNKTISGFIGENIINLIPESTFYDKKNNEYITDKSAIVPVLTKAIQEQYSEIEQLKKQIKELKELIQNK